jgi:hypothetical protein
VRPADLLRSLPIGTRVVVRHRVPGGFSDALGTLLACSNERCVVASRRGEISVELGDVVAAKPVPPPPVRRPGGPDRPSRET